MHDSSLLLVVGLFFVMSRQIIQRFLQKKYIKRLKMPLQKKTDKTKKTIINCFLFSFYQI
jgi:hypothetical protein